MSRELVTMWMAKYALSGGVKELQVEISDYCEGYARAPKVHSLLKIGRDVYETEKEANKAASAMRDKKISSLKQQIAKLEKLRFEP